jgi:hypothetical protein
VVNLWSATSLKHQKSKRKHLTQNLQNGQYE